MKFKANFTNPGNMSMGDDYDRLLIIIEDPCYFINEDGKTFYKGYMESHYIPA